MHQKHAKLSRPNYGEFGRNEWSIIGTPCSVIKELAFQLTTALSKEWSVAYVDADHKEDTLATLDRKKTAIDLGATIEYTDKISFHRFEKKQELNHFQFKQQFNEVDVVIVNGNHFKAKQQMVVIDPKKEDSLRRKLDRLTDVSLIILQEGVTEVFPFLKAHLTNFDQLPIVKISERSRIIQYLGEALKEVIPPLFGLVLAGGKSQRMGTDKGLIDYHGQPQRVYAYDLLNQFCHTTFLSFRENQETTNELPVIEDTFKGLGPFGAIVSAFRAHPNQAWLVIACDLPLLDKATLDYLIKHRNPAKLATAFHNPATNFPEPLITIWEPKAYPILLQFLSQGYSCPRKVLINTEIETISIPNLEALKNVNTKEEYKEVRRVLYKE